MRKITEQQYEKIQQLRDMFYAGVEKYCEDLQDTWDFVDPFEAIMEIIEDAKEE